MQENRSFDSYFGTYPGADGLPDEGRRVHDVQPRSERGCVSAPYHDPNDINGGAGHGLPSVHHGGRRREDGRLREGRRDQPARLRSGPNDVQNPLCANSSRVDVMGYHDAREIPNYWRYAHDFVLQDRMFAPVEVVEPARAPVHGVGVVGEVRVRATRAAAPTTSSAPTEPARWRWRCRRSSGARRRSTSRGPTSPTCSTSIRRELGLLRRDGQRARLRETTRPPARRCAQRASTPGSGTRFRCSHDVTDNGQLGNVQRVAKSSAGRARRPARSPRCRGSMPYQIHSEHPPASVHAGQAWVTGLINDVMRGKDWKSTADLRVVGRLGRLLRPRRRPRASTSTATASACPGS